MAFTPAYSINYNVTGGGVVLADCGRLGMNRRHAKLPNRSNHYQPKFYILMPLPCLLLSLLSF